MATPTSRPIAPAKGTLGVLCVGLGAVATTFIAGVELARRGKGKPFGSLTQMGTNRLGKRTEHRSPLIKDFVSLARLEVAPRIQGRGGIPQLRRRAPRSRVHHEGGGRK